MKIFFELLRRNIKMFFKDKGLFFTSLATPMILLVLYATFLRNVYKDSFLSIIPEALGVPEKVINGLVGSQLVSSLLAVSCVTVAFCSNFLSVQDKVLGVKGDIDSSPVGKGVLSISYYAASFISTLLICLIAGGVGMLYLAKVGWYLELADILFLLLDILLLTMFGTALSSVINLFLSSQGQISAVGSIVSSVYGFICGAYMPMSQFGEALQSALTFLPGTYGTALVRTHTMRGAFNALGESGFPEAEVAMLMKEFDCSIEFFGIEVGIGAMYAILTGTVVLLIALYILLASILGKKRRA